MLLMLLTVSVYTSTTNTTVGIVVVRHEETVAPVNDDTVLRKILTDSQTIAMLGASNTPSHKSYEILGFLLDYGYDVYPVNPFLAETGITVYDRHVYHSLTELAQEGIQIDLVEVFRNANYADDIVQEIVDVGDASAVWFQRGVLPTPTVITTAHQAGLFVAIDVCPRQELPRLGIPPKATPTSITTRQRKRSIPAVTASEAAPEAASSLLFFNNGNTNLAFLIRNGHTGLQRLWSYLTRTTTNNSSNSKMAKEKTEKKPTQTASTTTTSFPTADTTTGLSNQPRSDPTRSPSSSPRVAAPSRTSPSPSESPSRAPRGRPRTAPSIMPSRASRAVPSTAPSRVPSDAPTKRKQKQGCCSHDFKTCTDGRLVGGGTTKKQCHQHKYPMTWLQHGSLSDTNTCRARYQPCTRSTTRHKNHASNCCSGLNCKGKKGFQQCHPPKERYGKKKSNAEELRAIHAELVYLETQVNRKDDK